MSTDRRTDPYRNFHFLVQLDGVTHGGFSEVSGVERSVEPIDYREGSDNSPRPVGRRIMSLHRSDTVTLKRGLTTRALFDDWRASGTVRRRTVTVILCDEQRRPVRRWRLANAAIVKIEAPSLSATGNEVAIESLELTHEGLTLED